MVVRHQAEQDVNELITDINEGILFFRDRFTSYRCHSLPPLKLEHQRLETHSEMIGGLVDKRRSVLSFRKLDVELVDDLGCEGTHLHVREVSSDTSEWTSRERGECVFMLDEFGLGVPAFGDEFVGVDVVVLG